MTAPIPVKSDDKKPNLAKAASSSPRGAASQGIRRQREADLKLLCERFAVFREAKPLAIGIHKAIRTAMPEMSVERIRWVLGAHTRSTRYLKAVSQEAVRVDLDGQVAGEVTEEQRVQATAELRVRFRQGAERRRDALETKQRQEKLLLLAQKFAKNDR